MGCDIHCYVEYKSPESKYWESFGGHFNPGRDYSLFGRLAGIRRSEVAPLVEPRGIPRDLAFKASRDYWLWVSRKPDDSGTQVTRSQANEFVSSGLSRYNPENDQEISNPDWHTETWLTCAEFSQAISGGYAAPEYDALLAAMQSLEASGFVTRLVMWFDN